ncbi:MAG: hypothetical protein U0105_05465 [Candidatus Obscuribacterales bacterium]
MNWDGTAWQLPTPVDYSNAEANQLYDSALLLRMAHVVFDPNSTFLLVPFVLCLMVAHAAVINPTRSLWRIVMNFLRHYAIVFFGMFMLIVLIGRSVQNITAGLMPLTFFSFVSIMPLCVVLAAFAPFEWTVQRRGSEGEHEPERETKPQPKSQLEAIPESKPEQGQYIKVRIKEKAEITG